MSEVLRSARSLLYVPGDRPDRVGRALGSAADVVIIDTEDGVAPSARRAALETASAVTARNSDERPAVCVRLDPTLLPRVAELLGVGLAGIVLPGVEGQDQLVELASYLDDAEAQAGAPMPVSVIALVESARGLRQLDAICAGPRLVRLGMGEADLRADLGLDPSDDERELLPHRAAVVAASAAAGLAAPVGSTSTDFRDLARLRVTTDRLRRLGFRGRTAIHPDQVDVVNEIFTPSTDEVTRAQQVLEAFEALQREERGTGVGADGTMIDEAVVRSARDTLRRARTVWGGRQATTPRDRSSS